MSTWYSVQCNSSTGLILKWVWRNKKCSSYLFVDSKMTVQSNLCQACPSVRSSDVPALCIFNSNRQGNQILKKWAILLIQRKGIADNIYSFFVCCLAVSFASVPVIWWFKKKPKKFCTLLYSSFKIVWLNDRSLFFSLFSAELNDLNSSIAFTGF